MYFKHFPKFSNFPNSKHSKRKIYISDYVCKQQFEKNSASYEDAQLSRGNFRSVSQPYGCKIMYCIDPECG